MDRYRVRFVREPLYPLVPEIYLTLDMFTTLCKVVADISQLNKDLKTKQSQGDLPPHYEISYDIVLSFGLTELKAQIAWKEDVCTYPISQRNALTKNIGR